jgi:hypothetical protein
MSEARLRAMRLDSDGSTTRLRSARDALTTPMVLVLRLEAGVSPSSRSSAEGGSCHLGPSYPVFACRHDDGACQSVTPGNSGIC